MTSRSPLVLAVVGLGYVGLPLAVRFGLAGVRVIGYDVDARKIAELHRGVERMGEVDPKSLAASGIVLTNNPDHLAEANFVIIAVPTPITRANQPDLSALEAAARTVGLHLREGTVVVLESTVYPGVTEEILGPVLARESGLRAGTDFFLAYSPERANPGDAEHTVDRIIKVVAAQDKETLECVCRVYGFICRAGLHRAPTIKTAEAAKVIENVQRDLNVALVNELCLIFHRIGLNTQDVLAAAGTKWNFHPYRPGLVGGHCIGVDPYYLTYLAGQVGYHPEVILAGRRVNDGMADYVAELAVRGLIAARKTVQQARVLILGVAFKENVNDTRNSKVKDIIRRLREYGIEVLAHDPLVEEELIRDGFGVPNIRNLRNAPIVDGVVLAVPHRLFLSLTLEDLRARMTPPPVLVDVKTVFSRPQAEAAGFVYRHL